MWSEFFGKVADLVVTYPAQVATLTVAASVGAAAVWTGITAAARRKWPNFGDALAGIGPYIPWFVKALARALENRARARARLPPLPYEPLPAPPSAAKLPTSEAAEEAKRVEQFLIQGGKPGPDA